MQDLRGKVAVITGAGSGIGRATALAIVRHGGVVAVCDLAPDPAKETAVAIEALGGRSSVHVADVASEQEMHSLADAVLAEHGVVDIVVNCAGILVPPTLTGAGPLDQFRLVMDVNFWGVVYSSLFFLPHLLERPAANLVNVASNAALVAYSRVASYNASKFAVRGFTETLRMETRRTPLRVTLVCPGNTHTPLASNSPVMAADQRQSMQRFLDRMPGRPAEAVADAIVEGIHKDRPRVLTGADTRILDIVTRVLPGGHSRMLAGVVGTFMDKTLGT